MSLPPDGSNLTWHDADGLEWRLTPLGVGALRLAANAAASGALSARLAAVRRHAWEARPPGLRDLVVGYLTVTAEFRPGAGTAAVARGLVAATRHATSDGASDRTVTLSVRYGEAADSEALVERLGLSWRAIVARHAAARYCVAFLGFTPGFPYLHGLPASLALPRRSPPQHLPAGAVAIADGRAGVYPNAGPGGWWVLGTTRARLFDPSRPEPTALLPGDEVRFVPGDANAPCELHPGPPLAAAPPDPSQRPEPIARGDLAAARTAADPALTVLDAWPGGTTLQGRPRHAVGHLGMAQAGALDPTAFVAAAKLAGAPLDAPALELAAPHATLRAERPLRAAWTGGGARFLLDGRPVPSGRPFAWPLGATLEVRPDRASGGATAMLAVAGGLAPLGGAVGHPTLVGDGSTDSRAGVGGFGRALTAGDVLALTSAPRAPDTTWSGRRRPTLEVALRLHPGPHGEAEAYAAMLTSEFRLVTRDRMGARLAGPKLHAARPDIASEGVPLGAVQLPADGRPIVLLADRGRTGGYAVIGVVDPRDLPALAQARPGAYVTFEPSDG